MLMRIEVSGAKSFIACVVSQFSALDSVCHYQRPMTSGSGSWQRKDTFDGQGHRPRCRWCGFGFAAGVGFAAAKPNLTWPITFEAKLAAPGSWFIRDDQLLHRNAIAPRVRMPEAAWSIKRLRWGTRDS